MKNPSTYTCKKFIYVTILVSFQSAFLQNVCHGHFHWIKSYNTETRQQLDMFRRENHLTSQQKATKVREYLLNLFSLLELTTLMLLGSTYLDGINIFPYSNQRTTMIKTIVGLGFLEWTSQGTSSYEVKYSALHSVA